MPLQGVLIEFRRAQVPVDARKTAKPETVRAEVPPEVFTTPYQNPVGGNPEAALEMGIPVRGVLVSTYVISGFCAGIGAIVLADEISQGVT